MKTRLEIHRDDKVFTYEDLDMPLIPEGHLLFTPVAAACRVVSSAVVITNDEMVEQRLVAR